MNGTTLNGNGHLKVVRVGTRKSQLAMVQTEHVIDLLQKNFPEIVFEIVAMTTTGDNILDIALNKIGEKSLFTKELEVCLEKKEVDLVVHSMKDLPTSLPPKMIIAAVLEREDPRDVVILKNGLTGTIQDLPPQSAIGTSSVRRRAQLVSKFPNLKFIDIRGNLNTRLKKLDEGNTYDAIILAAAGVKRMGWENRISQYLSPEDCVHAVSQGAIAIECREDDEEIISLVWTLTHEQTLLPCIAERALMRKLEGGCSAPVAAHSELTNDGASLKILAGVWSLNGNEKRVQSYKITFNANDNESVDRKAYSSILAPVDSTQQILLKMSKSEEAGNYLAETLLADGAGEILQQARIQTQLS